MFMKKVFIVVCVIASVYLLAQISPAKQIISDIFVAVNNQSNQTEENNSLVSELEQKLLKLESNNKEVTQQLNARLTMLESEVDSLNNDELITQVNSLVSVEENSSVSQTVKNILPTPVETTESKALLTATNLKHDDSNKRLQQQAALRDLSEQLELMALASLSN